MLICVTTDIRKPKVRGDTAEVRRFHERPDVQALLAYQVELRLVLSAAAGRRQTVRSAARQIAGKGRGPAVRACIAAAVVQAHTTVFGPAAYNNAVLANGLTEVAGYNSDAAANT